MTLAVGKPPEITLYHATNLFIKGMRFAHANDAEVQHCHEFDHTTLLAVGRFRVTVNGQETEYDADVMPVPVFIAAGVQHTVTALSDGALALCIHALRNKDGDELLDLSSVPRGSNPLLSAANLVKRGSP